MLSRKMNKKSCRNCLFGRSSCRMWSVAGRKSKDAMTFFLKCSRNKIRQFFRGEMATNGRKRYFHIDENASSEQIYALLDDVESAEEDEIDNLMNDSDTEFITEEKITQAASTKDTSLTTPEAKLHIIPSEI